MARAKRRKNTRQEFGKNQDSKPEQKQKFKWGIFIFMAIFLLAIGLFVSFKNEEETIKKRNQQIAQEIASLQEMEKKRQALFSPVEKERAHPLLRPVHIFKDKGFAGFGTMILKKDKSPHYVVTAAHLFSETQLGSYFYSYKVFGPLGYVEEGSFSRVDVDKFQPEENPKGFLDIATCFIGGPGVITHTSKVRISGVMAFQEGGQAKKIKRKVTLTSLISGEKYPLVGELVTATSGYWLMLYESIPGESGGGFLGEGSNLYILSGNVKIEESWYEMMNIPRNFTRLTLMTGTKIKW